SVLIAKEGDRQPLVLELASQRTGCTKNHDGRLHALARVQRPGELDQLPSTTMQRSMMIDMIARDEHAHGTVGHSDFVEVMDALNRVGASATAISSREIRASGHVPMAALLRRERPPRAYICSLHPATAAARSRHPLGAASTVPADRRRTPRICSIPSTRRYRPSGCRRRAAFQPLW